ncbi:MAG: ATP-binding protein [Cyanobacteria bacterium J06648_16]
MTELATPVRVAETTSAKILIVEDELISAHNLADNLKQLGYTITQIVKNAEAAMAAVQQQPPDLVLMDIHLKGPTSGIDAARLMLQYRIPVIYLTAFSDDSTVAKAAATRPYGYLTKPAKLEDIKSALEMALARKEEDERWRALMVEEKRLNDLKSQCYAMLAHDLRTPLSVMLASLEIVRQYGERLTEARKQKHFQQIRSSIQQMTNQLEQVMTTEQIARDELPFQPERVEVVEAMRERVEAFQSVLADGQALTFTPNGGASHRWLDLRLIDHVVNNLISNAIKYSRQAEGGGKIAVQLDCQCDRICLTVKDNGIGMPPAFIEHIFDPFSRATNVGAIGGLGLGMHIVLKAVKGHRGTIDVTSQPGRGSCFTVMLPCLEHRDEARQGQAGGGEQGGALP